MFLFVYVFVCTVYTNNNILWLFLYSYRKLHHLLCHTLGGEKQWTKRSNNPSLQTTFRLFSQFHEVLCVHTMSSFFFYYHFLYSTKRKRINHNAKCITDELVPLWECTIIRDDLASWAATTNESGHLAELADIWITDNRYVGQDFCTILFTSPICNLRCENGAGVERRHLWPDQGDSFQPDHKLSISMIKTSKQLGFPLSPAKTEYNSCQIH